MHLCIQSPDQDPIQAVIPSGVYVAGSQSDCHIVIPHPSVARRHAEITVLSDHDMLVRSLDSNQPVLLDGEPLAQTIVRAGQQVQLGDALLWAVETDTLSPPLPEQDDFPAPPQESHASSWPQVWRYPWHADVGIVIAILVLIQVMPAFLPGILKILGFILTVPAAIYLLLYWRDIVHATVQGRDDIPSDARVSLDWETNKNALLGMLAIAMTCNMPLFLATWIPNTSLAVKLAAAGFGLYFLPMAALAHTVVGGLSILNPLFLFRAIFRTFWPYLGIILSLVTLIGLFSFAPRLSSWQASSGGWLLKVIIDAVWLALVLYGSFIWARCLGLFYRANRLRLDWEERL